MGQSIHTFLKVRASLLATLALSCKSWPEASFLFLGLLQLFRAAAIHFNARNFSKPWLCRTWTTCSRCGLLFLVKTGSCCARFKQSFASRGFAALPLQHRHCVRRVAHSADIGASRPSDGSAVYCKPPSSRRKHRLSLTFGRPALPAKEPLLQCFCLLPRLFTSSLSDSFGAFLAAAIITQKPWPITSQCHRFCRANCI